MIPVDGSPGAPVDVDLGGLDAMTPTGSASAPSTAATGRGRTWSPRSPRRDQLHPAVGPLFHRDGGLGIGAGADGVGDARARNQLLAEVPLFAVAADLYSRSGPAAAGVLKRSDTARVLARQILGPLGTIAIAHDNKP